MSDCNNRSYYCSAKFKFLKVDLESNTTYNCHAALPHDIDFDFLNKNPGNLFNIPVNVIEREQMLNNQRNKSCEQNCWAAEDRGAVSPRILQNGIEKTHTTIFTTPEIIDITVGGDCNLTCSYCCKEFSNAWRRDLIKNGDYKFTNNLSDRFVIRPRDRLLVNIKQADLKNSKKYQLLLEEISRYASTLKEIVITGGEPLLDNHFVSMLLTMLLHTQAKVKIYTGLGLSSTRFQKVISELKQINNLTLIISAESTHKFLEFNRYGIKWEQFLSKIDQLKKNSIDYVFQSTLTNLTLFGFMDFYRMFEDDRNIVSFAYQPSMMAPNILDDESKQYLTEQFKVLPLELQTSIIKSMEAPANEVDRINIREFLIQFLERRPDLNINIYPKSFLGWLGVKHVV